MADERPTLEDWLLIAAGVLLAVAWLATLVLRARYGPDWPELHLPRAP